MKLTKEKIDLKEKLAGYEIKPKENELIEYHCYNCDSVFEIRDCEVVPMIEPIYCPCCGKTAMEKC